MLSFLLELSLTKHDSNDDKGTLIWRCLHGLGGTINYYGGASYCFGQNCQGLL
jgi:hypothetical protein